MTAIASHEPTIRVRFILDTSLDDEEGGRKLELELLDERPPAWRDEHLADGAERSGDADRPDRGRDVCVDHAHESRWPLHDVQACTVWRDAEVSRRRGEWHRAGDGVA